MCWNSANACVNNLYVQIWKYLQVLRVYVWNNSYHASKEYFSELSKCFIVF